MRAQAAVLLLLLAACSSRRDGEEAARPRAEAGAHADPAGDHEEGGEQVVRVADDMLRDLKLSTAAVETRAGDQGAAVLGELHVDEERYAEVSSPLAAEALRLRAGPGEAVRAGQALVDLASLEAGRARGSLREAEARRQLALQALTRKRGLADERIVPRREVQEAEAEFQAAEASLASARAALASLRIPEGGEEGGRFALTAPIAGVVLERSVVRGQVVEAGRTLFKLGDLSRLWVVAHASERDAVRVPAGATARVAIPALPGESFQASVAHVGAQVDAASRTIPVRLTLANRGGSLRPGMSATVWLPVGGEGSLLAVPVAALQRLHDSWCVFVPKGRGVFEVRPVGRGRDLGGEVEIVSGARAGEVVVVEGAFLLKAEAEKAEGEGAHHDH
ncbi:MAG: efflux RND transporter periplasmic adaptor subunit [Vicinamibacteria bacterium]